MNIAELFVNLGIRGSEKTIGSLTQVKSGLGDAKNMAVETKVAILGAMYAVERLFAASGQRGTDLMNFNALLGTGSEMLQRYQYAARQAGLSNQEMTATFGKLAEAGTRMRLGGPMPTGFPLVQKLTGMQPEEMLAGGANPEIILKRLREYAQKEKDIVLRNATLRSFGLSDDMISALVRGKFNDNVLNSPDAMKNAFTLDQQKNLDNYRAGVEKLQSAWEKFIGDFNSEHGLKMLEDLTKVSTSVMALATSFEHLSRAIHLFDHMGTVFQGWSEIFTLIAMKLDDIMGVTPASEKAKPMWKRLEEAFGKDPGSKAPAWFTRMMGGIRDFKPQKEDESTSGQVPKKPSDKPGAVPKKLPATVKKPGGSPAGSPYVPAAPAKQGGILGTLPPKPTGPGVTPGGGPVWWDTSKAPKKPAAPAKTVPSWFMRMMQKLESVFTPVVKGNLETTAPPPDLTPRPPVSDMAPAAPTAPAKRRYVPGEDQDDTPHRRAAMRKWGNTTGRPTHDDQWDKDHPDKPKNWDRSKATPVPTRSLDVPPSPTAPSTRPVPPAAPAAAPSAGNTIHLEQNLNFQHEGKEPFQLADASKRGINEAFRTMNANGQAV